MGRTDTVSIRLDPRLNYLCELAARSQRRTKSSFIEATIAEKIDAMHLRNWTDASEDISIGDRASYLWHVRESQRLCSLALVAPHLLTFEEQEIWEVVRETSYFWRGNWQGDSWTWKCNEGALIRERVDEYWVKIQQVAAGEADKDALPRIRRTSTTPKREPPSRVSPASDLDDEIPF